MPEKFSLAPDQFSGGRPETLRRVWTRHFERIEGGDCGKGGGAGLQQVKGRGPGDRVESPYDTDARFRTKAGTTWTGTMVHFTETCDDGAPRLVVHADTTLANVHEAPRTAPIHTALAAKGLAPSEHLVDSAYVSADHFITARKEHGIDLVGPSRRSLSWHSLANDGWLLLGSGVVRPRVRLTGSIRTDFYGSIGAASPIGPGRRLTRNKGLS